MIKIKIDCRQGNLKEVVSFPAQYDAKKSDSQ